VRRRLAALGLALAVGLLVAGCGSSSSPPEAVAAPPQEVDLAWVEHSPADGPGLTFRVTRFAVTATGWEADVAVENHTDIGWQLGEDPVAVGQSFGIMLFSSGELDEVERRSADGELPGLRPARTFEPPLAATLAPGKSWDGTVGAEGALAAGRWVRVVFGPLVAEGDPPDGMPSQFAWITDHSYRLKP
jgi:hypothetical protein